MRVVVCRQCKRSFVAINRGARIFCIDRCRDRFFKELDAMRRASIRKSMARKCANVECQATFTPSIGRGTGKVQKFCSARCRNLIGSREWRATNPTYGRRYAKPSIRRQCVMCSKLFSNVRGGAPLCCSEKCRKKYRQQYARAYGENNPDVRRRAEANRIDYMRMAKAAAQMGLVEGPLTKERQREIGRALKGDLK